MQAEIAAQAQLHEELRVSQAAPATVAEKPLEPRPQPAAVLPSLPAAQVKNTSLMPLLARLNLKT